jgi:hypothetical protein
MVKTGRGQVEKVGHTSNESLDLIAFPLEEQRARSRTFERNSCRYRELVRRVCMTGYTKV